MKIILIAFFSAFISHQVLAQKTTIVENAQKSQYENTSYLVVGSLTLKPGFNFNSAQQGTFFARAYNNDPSAAPTEGRNFVRSEAVLKPGMTTDDQVVALGTGGKLVSFSYSDGLGREVQSIQVQASSASRDIVQPSYFDSKNRPSRSYLPYTATGSSGGFRTSALTEQAAFYSSPPAGIPADSKAYATTTFEDSPLERVLSTTNVGNDFQNAAANGRFSVNTAGTVRKWGIVNGLPRSTTTYPAGSLSVQTSTGEAGAVSRTYADFAGRTVLEQVQSTASAWFSTYYVYNDYGELLFIVPPQSAATLTPDQTYVNLWHFQYEYDAMGRQIGSKAPGAGWVYTVYDRWDRPVLTQDSVQRAKSPAEWTYVKYDVHNRPVITGIMSSASTRAGLTTDVANSSIRDENRNSSAVGYTLNRTYPKTATEANLISITYYDDYSFRNNTGWSPNNGLYAFAEEPGYSGQQLAPGVKGLATGSKSRTQGTNTAWMHSVTYYDKYYRPIQSISSHQMGGTVKTSTQYAFSGETEKNVDNYTHNGGSTRVERRYTYDHAGRPLKVYHKINSNAEVMLSHFQYNELGQATDIIHHSRNDGRTWLYRTSLKSTIQGWTDEIRYMYSNGDQVFRQKLDYQKASGTGNSPRLDGLATANQWKHYGAEPERAYNYTYDLPKRLTASTYRQKSGTSWSSNNFYNENGIVYSANGNITALARYKEKAGASAHIDQLAYSYNGNQLTGVSDTAPAAHKADGFGDGNTSGADYAYNGNGFLASDKNKGITSIVYNLMDLPTQINFASSNSIKYTYSAGGGLMTVAYQGSGGFPNKTIQYVGELVFEGTVLKEIRHGSGRVLADAGYKYQYYLADHLGSTRVVLQENPANFTVTATFEQAAKEEESMQFMDYENSVRIASSLFDHTGTEETGQALRLIGGETGPARSVSVLPGDTVKMEVYAKYLDLSETKTNPALMAVAASLAGGSPAVMGIEGGLSAPAATSASGSNSLAGLLSGKQQNDGAPPAYLNYLFFDQEMNYKYGGFVQMSEAAMEDGTGRQHERLYLEAVAEEPGYFYIYLSNESTGGEAFFDDFGITTLESYIVQQTDYYPYGLTARNYVRTGEKETLDLFQGKTYEQLTGWHDFHARQYDAALGRWFGVDPQNQFASPYLAMGNNPVMMVDPDGEFVFSALLPGIGTFIDAALWGAVIGGSGYTANVAMSPGGFNNWNGGQFWRSVGMGAVSGVATAGIGSMMGPVGSQGLAGEIGRAMMHGQSNMMIGAAFGQQPSIGSYLTGFASSLAGSSFMMYGGKFANSTAGLYGFSGMAGGLTASATGGNFWQGAAVGLMNAGLNHARSNVDAAGARYFPNKKAFYDHLWRKSLDADDNPIREVSGWELENGGGIALDYSENTISQSKWNSLKTGKLKSGGIGVEFKEKIYKAITSAHTHPRNDYAPDGSLYVPRLSPSDKIHIDVTGFRTIHILYDRRIWLMGSGNVKNLGSW